MTQSPASEHIVFDYRHLETWQHDAARLIACLKANGSVQIHLQPMQQENLVKLCEYLITDPQIIAYGDHITWTHRIAKLWAVAKFMVDAEFFFSPVVFLEIYNHDILIHYEIHPQPSIPPQPKKPIATWCFKTRAMSLPAEEDAAWTTERLWNRLKRLCPGEIATLSVAVTDGITTHLERVDVNITTKVSLSEFYGELCQTQAISELTRSTLTGEPLQFSIDHILRIRRAT
jgi:hypothetical protein